MERFTTIVENVREQFAKCFMPAMAIVILVALFSVAIGGVSQNNRWQIDTIEIDGAHTVSVDAIREIIKNKLSGNYFFIYSRGNSYLFSRNEIEYALLETFPRLASAQVFRNGNHTIKVVVSERKPYALWCGEISDGSELPNCWFIDITGFVFDKAPAFSTGVYMEVYGKLDEKNNRDILRGVLPSVSFATANNFARLVRAEVGEPIRIAFKDEEEINLTIQSSQPYPFLSGVIVRFKNENDPVLLLKNLLVAIRAQFPESIALKKKLLYIDMRFGNKIFFGFE